MLTEYEFEIGVVTLPAHMVIFAAGLLILDMPLGKIATITGFFGTIAAISSLIHGAKEIEF